MEEEEIKDSGEESLGEGEGESGEESLDEGEGGESEIEEGDGGESEIKEGKEVAVHVEKDPSKIYKESLNTLIVSLRPCIAQAKVHLIHQLARQVAGLKKKKCANDQEKAKNERKVARFVEEISILKRANKDIISRWLVVNNKTFAEVTKQETLKQKFNMRVRVFVRTGEHHAVKKVLDSFKVKYPHWEKEVPKVLRTLGKKRKKTDPNQQELGIKPIKSAEVPKDSTNQNESVIIAKDVPASKTTSESAISKKDSNVVEDEGSQSEVESGDDESNADSNCNADNAKDDESIADSECGADDAKNDESNADSESDTDDGIVHHNENKIDDESETDENIFKDDEHVFDKDDPANYSDSESDGGDRDGSDESDAETDSGDEEIFVSSLKEALKMSQGGPSKKEQVSEVEKPGKINKKSGEMVVKVLDLKNAEVDDDNSEDDSNKLIGAENSKKSSKISSFFVGGESESEEENDENFDEEELPYGEDVLQMRQESLKNKFQREGRAGVGLNGQGGFVRGGRGRGNDDRGRGRGSGTFDTSRGRGRGDFERGRGRGDFQQRGRGRGDFQRGGRGKTFNESRGGDFNSVNVKSAEVDSNVHPSWAAKKRLNTSIAKFEGKKIKFGDEGDSFKTSKPAYVPHVVKAPSNAGPAEKLHPSWAAKQNQKASIQAFQGKKIKFGDDGDSVKSSKPAYVPAVVKAPSNAVPPEKLHPSWAAKQNQKSSIQAFQGKKVVFGD